MRVCAEVGVYAYRIHACYVYAQVLQLLPKDLPAAAVAATADVPSELLRLVPPALISDHEGVRTWHKMVSTCQ